MHELIDELDSLIAAAAPDAVTRVGVHLTPYGGEVEVRLRMHPDRVRDLADALRLWRQHAQGELSPGTALPVWWVVT